MAYSRLNKYQEQTILTMTPGEMVVRLFEESEKQLNIAMVCIDDKNIQGANNALQKAQRIFTYLKASLDFNYQLSENLSALYDFFNRRLVEANMKKSRPRSKRFCRLYPSCEIRSNRVSASPEWHKFSSSAKVSGKSAD